MVEENVVQDYGISPRDSGEAGARWLQAAVILLTVVTAWKLPFWLAHPNGDLTEWFIPWLDHVLRVGRLHALEASFTNYNPPYIYMLSLASLFSGVVPPLIVVKLTNLPFSLFASATVYVSCRAMGCSVLRAFLGAVLVLVAPEEIQNAWSWGQCDIIYSSFLLAFLSAVHFRKPALGMAFFALALSFKLQTMFLGPVILLLLLAGEIPLWALAVVPVVYTAMLIPAMLEGRTPISILMVYGSQYGFYNSLSYGVANPYKLIGHWADLRGLVEPIKRVGLIVSALCNGAFLWYVWRHRKALRTFSGLLVASTLCILLEVYSLPKMHERYFFPADLLLLMLVALNPKRYWLPALIMQVVSVIDYSPFLYRTSNSVFIFLPTVLMVTGTLWLLIKELGRLGDSSEATARP